MQRLRKVVTITTLGALLLGSVNTLYASGEGYEDSQCCYFQPEYAVGGLAIVAIVAIALSHNNGNNDTHSSHSH